MKLPWIPLLLMLMVACATPERRLPQATGGWNIDQFGYDYVVDQDVTAFLDTSNFGRLIFEEGGGGQYFPANGDSAQIQGISWSQLSDTRVRFSFERMELEGFDEFEFRILQDDRNQQLWRAEEVDKVYNPLRADSSDVRLLVQMELSRL